jgi:outer membrane protein assembly factor BamE (lipoprotein component of BamABCDE complex)
MKAMTRRRVLCGLLFASALLACFAGWLWLVSGPQVTRAKFKQVHKGMTREEVIRTVGGPPGNYSRADEIYLLHRAVSSHWTVDRSGTAQDLWIADDAELRVKFDDAGTATTVMVFPGHFHYGPVVLRPLTLTERIRRWLGL